MKELVLQYYLSFGHNERGVYTIIHMKYAYFNQVSSAPSKWHSVLSRYHIPQTLVANLELMIETASPYVSATSRGVAGSSDSQSGAICSTLLEEGRPRSGDGEKSRFLIIYCYSRTISHHERYPSASTYSFYYLLSTNFAA